MENKPKKIDDDLPHEFIREIKRRAADLDDPVRYIIYSQIIPNDKRKLFFNISDSTFCESIDTATLFKREYMAKAAVKAYSVENDNILYVAKITTKNDKRKILKYKI